MVCVIQKLTLKSAFGTEENVVGSQKYVMGLKKNVLGKNVLLLKLIYIINFV